MSDNHEYSDLEKQFEKVRKEHEKYRASGLTLMTTIITLSSGSLLLPPKVPGMTILTIGFSLPLVLALLQGLYNYLGQLRYARSESHLHESSVYRGADQIKEAVRALRSASALQKDSSVAYKWADCLCEAMVWSFIVVLLIVICRMSYARVSKHIIDWLSCTRPV